MNLIALPNLDSVEKFRKLLISYIILFLFIQIYFLGIKLPIESEGWFSDIAYHLNWEFNGNMGKDIPWGASWNGGIGKSFFLIHYLFYKIFGVGLFQARLVSLVSGVLLLFLLFRWNSKNISFDVAILTTILLTISISFWPFLPNAREDLMHCFFSMLSFFLISSAIFSKKNIYFLLAGFFCALSVDISWRGIEIVLCVYLFSCLFFERETFLKHSILLLVGSFLAFIYWISLNIIPMGIQNFIDYAYNYNSLEHNFNLFSEIERIKRMLFGSTVRTFVGLLELIYVIPLLVIFYRYRKKYYIVSNHIILWLVISFVVMSLVDNQSYPQYLLVYSPFIYILCSIGFYELFNYKKNIAYTLLFFILSFATTYQVGRIAIYSYHQDVKNDVNISGYFEKLRSSVDLNKNIIGNTEYWYAFKDAKQYYGGAFYLNRVITILKELKPADEYENDYDRANAILDVFKKREIEYIVGSYDFKGFIQRYFSGNELPSRNFGQVNTITNQFLHCGSKPTDPHCNVYIYKIISYKP